jgi:hypothetical protein
LGCFYGDKVKLFEKRTGGEDGDSAKSFAAKDPHVGLKETVRKPINMRI